MIIDTGLIIAGYLLGSVASAIIVCKLLGLPDPRQGGSGNPGATNVLRLGGKKAAAITLAGDLLKGFLPVLAAAGLSRSDTAIGAVGIAAFLGHLYPVFFRFQGGKGIATAFGVVAGLSWVSVLAMAATWLLMARLSRYSSLGALTACTLTPGYIWLATASAAFAGTTAVIAVFTYWRHRGNIRRLLSGTEPRIGEKAVATEQPPAIN
ncbi:MAG: glycerol-3-phosphate 1-O-acyltransferase PlsY [Gammaproteobacteria bacterium]|nr:glycerol-3-phosphate 1-O-acyltransferase PlsY [Gammaproteobacteria bacterium]